MNFTEALEAALLDHDAPIITYYEFFVLGHQMHIAGEWKKADLNYMPAIWDQKHARNAMQRLEKRRSIAPDSDFRSGVWRIVQTPRSGAAEEVACIADPFCYVSHLSAMQRYGLTNRNPEALHITTPSRPVWNALRDEKISRDFSDYRDVEHPALPLPGFGETIRQRRVVVHKTSHPAKPVSVRGERTRIASIGRTFADMLAQPALCGGMAHVLDIWADEAERWMVEIIEEVDRFEAKIVKVRAGYILSEVLGLADDRIRRWEKDVQRGGSRKLDPDAPYENNYSDRWMISINV